MISMLFIYEYTFPLFYSHCSVQNLENAARQTKGDPALPEEDLSKIFRPILPPTRLTPMLLSGQVDLASQQINAFCSQALAKLFLSESLAQTNCETSN